MQASALAAREHAHFFLLVATVKVKAPAVSAAGHLKFAHRQNIQAAGDVFPHGFVVRKVVAGLVHKRHLSGLANFDFALIRLFFARNHFEQGGLTRPVGPDDAHNGARRHLKAQVINQQAVAKRFAHALKFNHLVAQTLGHGNKDFLGFVALLVFKVAQLFKPGQACLALGLAAFGVGAGPLQLFLHGFGAGVFGALLLLQAGLFLLQPGGVVALVGNAVTAVELQYPLCGVV